MTERTEVFVVDRVEGAVMILIPNGGVAQEVPRTALAEDIGEGAVVRVPLDRDGSPLWPRAVRDPEMEGQLLDEGRRRLAHLEKRDPGGDVVL